MTNQNRVKRNWVDLNDAINWGHEKKMMHVKTLIGRLDRDPNSDPILNLIHSLRIQAIATFYFPRKNMFRYIINKDHSKHKGWTTPCTSRERMIIEMFDISVRELKSNRNITPFNKADIEFGKYRHEKWLESQR